MTRPGHGKTASDTWLILLRGINVGGRNVIPMRELREAFADMGFDDPATYIQSGNVIVGSSQAKSARTVMSIERHLSSTFAYDAKVLVRTAAEMREVAREIPWSPKPGDRSTRYNVIFLADAVPPGAVVGGLTLDPAIESATLGRQAIYWSAPLATITRSAMLKLSSHPLYPEMTVRNLRTTSRLAELMAERTEA